MANPSLKNGYVSIANELVEKLASLSIPSSEMRLIWVVWRKTWGWIEGNRRKDWDWIALSQFEEMTTMKHGNVAKGLKSLVVKRILVKQENRLKFNQNYDEWVVCKRIPPVVKRILGGSQTHTKIGSQTHTNKRNKTTNTKETTAKDELSPFSWEEYLQKMDNHSQRKIQIISYYFQTKGIKFDSLAKAQSAIRRHLRAARELEPFSDEEINKASIKAIADYKELWTIETLVKILTR